MVGRINLHTKDPGISNAALRECYNHYLVMLNICKNAKDRAIADKSNKYLFSLAASNLGEKYKNERTREIEIYFDALQEDLFVL